MAAGQWEDVQESMQELQATLQSLQQGLGESVQQVCWQLGE